MTNTVPGSSASGGGAREDASLVWILGMLAAFGAMSVDMYLPSLPTIGRDLGASPAEVQLTLSSFFVGFAIGQLLYGPLSDRYGRRPILLFGITLYIATSALCATSESIESLTAFRFLHALGGGAGSVVARAIVRDRFDLARRARALSLMMVIMGIAPLLAPLAGGQILALAGWRAIFWLLTGFGAVCLVATLWRIEESNPATGRRRTPLYRLFSGYARVIRHRDAMGCILAGGFVFAGMFAYISGTPFVYIEYFGVPPEAYGFLFGLNVIALMGGAYANTRLAGRFGLRRLMAGAALSTAGAGLLLLAAAWTGAGGLAGIVVPLFLYMAGLNLIAVNAIALATEDFPYDAGAVTALFGGVQIGLGAVAGIAVGQLHDGTPVPMSAVIAACGLLAVAAERGLRPRHPRRGG